MAAPTITPDPPAPTASHTILATPGWPWALGTWYYRIACCDVDYPPFSKLSPASAEQSFTVAANQLVALTASGMPANYWPAVFLSQTSGAYANGLVVLISNLHLPVQGSAGGSANVIPGFQPVQLAPHDLDLVNGLPNLRATGGTALDPITIAGIATAFDPAGSVILRPPDSAFAAGANPGPFLFPGSLTIGSSSAATYLRMLSEAVALRGGLTVDGGGAAAVTVAGGIKSAGGSRADGPTIILLGAISSSVQWTGAFELYAGAAVDASENLLPGAAGAPDPWVGSTPAFIAPSELRVGLTNAAPWEAWRFDSFGNVAIVSFGGAGTWQAVDVGVHDQGGFSFIADVVEGLRAESVDTGLKVESVPLGSSAVLFDSCTVVERVDQDVQIGNVRGDADRQFLDCAFNMAADDNDPMVLLGNLWRSDLPGTGGEIQILHRLDVLAVDLAGLPVAGVTVRIIDALGTEVAAPVTAADGTIVQQRLLRTVDSQTPGAPSSTPKPLTDHVAAGDLSRSWRSPYTIQVERAGYRTTVLKVPLDQALRCVFTNLPDESGVGPIMVQVEARTTVGKVSAEQLAVVQVVVDGSTVTVSEDW